MSTKIRFVRCPKCRLVLPEPAEVPVYQCGGCGTVLQAKIRKTDAIAEPKSNPVQSNPVQANPASKPTVDHASEDIVAPNLNQESTIISSKDSGKDQCDSATSVKEQSGCINHSEDPRSSTDISSHENPESSPEAGALIDSDTDTCHPDQENRTDQIECNDSDKEQHVDISMSDGIYSSPELNYHQDSESPRMEREVDESKFSLDEENVADQDELEDSSRELPVELTSREVEESLHMTVRDKEGEENSMKGSAFRSLIAEKLLDSRPRKLVGTSKSGVDDVARFRSHKFQGFDHTASVKTLEGTTLSKPTYNDYDSSASSFDGNDDQVADDSHIIPRRRSSFVTPKELPIEDVARGKLGRNQNAMNRDKWPHEFPGPVRNRQSIRDMNALKGGDTQSRFQSHKRSSRASYGDSSTSTVGLNKFQYNSMYHPPIMDPESEKLELLRMVHQLQDQLDRTHLLSGHPSGSYPARVAMKEKQMSSSYYHLAAEREMHHDLDYSRYPLHYGQGKSWSQQYQPSQTAFSGDTLQNRSHIDCSCFHCYSQDRHYSAQLPPRDIYTSKVHYGTHYTPYQSGPSSPPHHTGSEYSSWSRETRSNEQWHRKDRDIKNHNPPKRHFRPVAGGSPLIACYLCTETLQLPADFLLFRRRYHSLKCSACSKVLKFSSLNRSHLVPYVPESETVAPPPSEVDEYNEPNKARILKTRTSYGHHAASVSYSDDYERAFSKDYSTETDHLSIPAPFDRNMPPVGTSESKVDRKKKSVLQNIRSQLVQSSGTGKFSSRKVSSEIEEIEETNATSGSPLHRLMGYASPSKVIRGD